MKATTSQRLNELMQEQKLRQVDILNKSIKYQKELGIKMGKSALSQYVSGKSVPDQDKLVLLGKTLGVNESWLMGYDVPREATNITEKEANTVDLTNLRERVVMFDGKPLSDEDVKKIEAIIKLSLGVGNSEDK
ncbi:helix-turn-helix domain-containing protein [Streptococcus parauberis]|uniref:helix-turn-helix domain-containing protein n=1 Tax=Streptococcus parauberis TaxID=1348 RepID=UPI000E30A4D0|nr:helix-turn-helix domain-containing protein [Streptococcus parauberis]RFE01119.1 helix-turn-helix protein [Streptococcus parauberis]